MNKPIDSANELLNLALDEPVNLSRRRFLTGTAVGALVLGFGLPLGSARALAATATAAERGTQVPAFLEIRPDGTVRLLSPFMEGGQGTHTAMAQIVGEELDADPATFVVESAPPGEAYVVMENGLRITGGSMSVRMSYPTMRRLGALARAMLLQAGAEQLGVPVAELSTAPGRVLHAASGRSLGYGELAGRALDMPVPDPASITLRDPSQFRWIGKPVRRVDAYEKSTGKALYSIDLKVDGMLHAAVQHAPRLGMTVGSLRNEAQVKAMKGVHSVHQLPGAVAVVAERWWHAKRAVEAIQVDWLEAAADSKVRAMPADFSSDAFRDFLAAQQGPARDDENEGDVAAALASAKTRVEATYHNQYLNHAQLEPPSALARYNPDGSLEVWLPNQAPDMFRDDIARRTGLSASQITLHSPLLGGFFGRHFLYDSANPYPQAIALAKAVGRPVKLIWSREEEFVRDALRPVAVVKFRAALDAEGLPVAIEAVSATEGPTEAIAGKQGEKLDPSGPRRSVGQVLRDCQQAHRADLRQGAGDARLLAFGGQLAQRLLLRSLPRRIGGQRWPRPLRAPPAPAARQPAPDHAVAGGGRTVRRLEAWPVHRRGRHSTRPRRGHGLAIRLVHGGDRRGVDRRRPGQGPRHLAGHRPGQHRQPGDRRGPGQWRRGPGVVPGVGGRSGLRRRQATGAQLRPVPDPAAFTHGAGACTDCREWRKDGWHRRAPAPRGGAGSGQRGSAADRPAHP
ncbi:putative isoquinoline 1-oxidoreductase, beta subunit [Pseudomonas chlororaphis O6]|uniref:Isoquinoline 1-oxidoreductase, beta subunit n=1 Tax=Pseudomonas chlororaphis O6 TaxID=1037915 RepID=A0AB33WQD2_9PSED|nr:putative isoquinoline 1-oxidoreductase, beta subunit [Pseudomonas chlororaphis O6]